jgi:hypothetical protein
MNELRDLEQKLASHSAARQALFAELGRIRTADDTAKAIVARLIQFEAAAQGDEIATLRKACDLALQDSDILQRLIGNSSKTLSLLARMTDENAALSQQLDRHTLSIALWGSETVRIPRGYTIGFLSTMPRSGTWYAFHFFENFYRQLTRHELGYERHHFEVYPELALAKAHVHANCPGFIEHCRGPERDAWNALSGELPGYDYAAEFVAANRQHFSPTTNRRVRIIYLYRNPLDQIVSVYHHFRRHRDYQGMIARIPDERALLRETGLDSYIKQFLTFRHMATAFPDNVMLVSYEELMRAPAGAFSRMLEFWNLRVDSAERRSALAKSLENSSVAKLRELETKLGHSLADDRVDRTESHIQSGEIGRWRQVFDNTDLAYAGARLQQFGMSLGDFTLT